jgi:hypothetical protein
MFRLSGKPRHWFATTVVVVGRPLLLAALILAAATPSSRVYPSFVVNAADEASAALDGMLGAVAFRTSEVAIDFAGWELYLHSTDAGLPSVGLVSAAGALPRAKRIATGPDPGTAGTPLPIRGHYRSQAPPA